jgi:hypothetical protein
MKTQVIKKEVVYTMPYTTKIDIQKAQQKRDKLYDKYDSVQVYPNGLDEVRIVCSQSQK